jgi:uncharacterized protein (DUF1499 family)
MKRKVLTTLAVVVGVLITATLVTASIWPVLNVVETGKTRAYPDVLPQYFSADPKRVFDECVAAIESFDNWAVTSKQSDAGVLKAKRTTRLGFVDELTITVSAETEFVTRISALSRSTVGKGDLGQNARNIRELQAELDSRLGAVRFDPYAAAQE